MYGCESWTMKKAECQRIDAFELWCWRRTLESPLDCKEIQPVHPKGDQSWVFIGRTDVEAETPILWPPNVKNWVIWKDPDAGKDWRQEETGIKTIPMEKKSQGWSPSEWTGWISLQSKGLSRVFSNTTVQNINSSALSFLHSPTLTPIHDHWKNHSLD